MINLQKASLSMNGNSVNLTMPISKIDEEKRIVSGFATLDNIDKQGDRVLPEASQKAFANFRGNVRLMHQPIPAGKVVSFRSDTFFDPETSKQYTGVFVDAYVSKGAQDIWEMVLDGTLTGFSIGGAIKDTDNELDEESNKTVRVIKEYDLVELSLVDSPANQFANIFSIQKTLDGDVVDGMFSKSNIQNVFWCETEEMAYLSSEEKYSCASCSSELSSIGWIDEITKANVEQAMSKIIEMHKAVNPGTITSDDVPKKYPKQNPRFSDIQTESNRKKKKRYEMEKASFSTGDFVQWNASGGTARGKITRVVTNGKIKVPNSSFTITGTPEDPAVTIRVYQKDGDSWKPSKTVVGHKMSTLRSWTVKVLKSIGVQPEVSLPNTVVNKANDEKESVAIQINEGGVDMTENNEVAEDATVEEIVEVSEEVVVDEIVEAEEAPAEEEIAKSDEVEAAEETVETSVETEESTDDASTDNGEATDLEKTLSEIKNFVGEALTKSGETNAAAVNGVVNTVAEVTKALTDKLVENDSRFEEINKGLADIVSAVQTINGRLESVENDTAVKKSGELESSTETTIQKSDSVWGGRFLSSSQYLN
jgi:phage head maturation protease